MIRNIRKNRTNCNTNPCDLENLNSLQRQRLLSGLDSDAMMQLEEVLAANMKRRDEKYIQNHPYAITHNKDGRWITNVYDLSGKRKTIAGRSLEELHEKLVVHYKELEKGQAITFPIVCKEWLEDKFRHKEITPASYAKYITDHKRFFIDRESDFCKIPVEEITDSDLRRFIKDTIADQTLTKKTYKQMQILLKGALLYAKEEGYTDFSAGTFFSDLVLNDRLFARKEKPSDEEQVFNDEEVPVIMNYLWEEQDIRDLGLILMFQTGMRVGELAALKQDSIKGDCILVTATEETFFDPETEKKINESGICKETPCKL